MKASEALIAWTPAHCKEDFSETAGRVNVGHLIRDGESDWARPYLNTGGAAFIGVRRLTGSDAVAQVFITFHELVVRDGIPPEDAHQAFLAIDDYASHLAPDTLGSEGNAPLWARSEP